MKLLYRVLLVHMIHSEKDFLRHEEVKLIKHQLPRESRYLGPNMGQGGEVPMKRNILCHPGVRADPQPSAIFQRMQSHLLQKQIGLEF